jgi:hypothetical protein
VAKPEQVARVIALVASPEADHMSGTIIPVDGAPSRSRTMEAFVPPLRSPGMPTLTVGDLSPTTLMLFGEAYSKSSDFFHVPLRPDLAAAEERRYLKQALVATMCLTGLGLPESEVDQIVGPTPASIQRPARSQALVNVRNAIEEVECDWLHRRSLGLTPQAFRYFNSLLVRDLPAKETYGKRRPNLVGWAATDRALSVLCEVLNHPNLQSPRAERAFTMAFVKAALVHLCIVGGNLFPIANRSTAIIVQYGILLQSGLVPKRHAHLLSISYGSCPDRYQSEIDRALAAGDATTFVDFSISNYMSTLRNDMESLRVLWPQQRSRVDWINHVHATYPERHGAAARRQIALALSIPDEPTTLSTLRHLTATLYGKGAPAQRLMRSDLAALRRRGLARSAAGSWQAARHGPAI